MHEQTLSALEKSEATLKATKIQYSEIEKTHADECQRMVHVLLQTIDRLTSHKDHIQQNLAELNEHFSKILLSETT
jgi:hypothetical protein